MRFYDYFTDRNHLYTSKPATLLIKNLLLVVSLFSAQLLLGQVTLAGLWEGTISVGGIYSSQTLPMELYLLVEGRKIEGRSYIKTPEGTIVQMHMKGTYHSDHSMSMKEVKFIGDPSNSYIPKFSRQYQMTWKADLWDSEVNGFWQEITEKTFDNYRRRGRIRLRKAKSPGA